MASELLRVIECGYCTAPARLALGRGRGRLRFPARALLVHDDELGNVLVDTGYAPRFADATPRFPERAYAIATPFRVSADETAIAQLAGARVDAVVLSHLHADHVAGLLDFPDVPVYLSRDALGSVEGGWQGTAKGILQALLPPDLEARSVEAEGGSWDADAAAGLGGYRHGGLVLVPLPGHAPGHLGVLVGERLLYAGDAYWHRDNLLGYRPSRLASRILHDPEYDRTMDALVRARDAGLDLLACHEERGPRRG